MKAFFLIHAAMVLEIILAVLVVLKLQDYIFKIRRLDKKIIQKSTKKVKKLQLIREKLQIFNKKCEQKMNLVKNIISVKNLIVDLSIQGLIKRFLIPKNSFLSKMFSYKTTIFWFLASFLLFRNKNA